MHTMILVIGDNPAERARDTDTPMGTPDWAGIGGRYQQQLIPLPGATTGRIYGDAMPAFEAHVLGLVPPDVRGGRGVHGMHRGSGVDQIRRVDLDVLATVTATIPAYLLDADGVLHDPGFTPEEEADQLLVHLAANFPNAELRELLADPAVIAGKQAAWEEHVTRILGSTDPGELVTVVDVHI